MMSKQESLNKSQESDSASLADNDHDFHSDIDPDINFLEKIKKESVYYSDELLNKTISRSNGFSIIHFNIRSLNANFKALESYLSQLKFKFDVIAISETWISKNTVTNIFNIDGYDFTYVSRSQGKGGGVAVYVNSSIKFKKFESKSLSVEDSFECITIELSLNSSKNVIIACIYRKPGAKIDEFTNKMEEMFGNFKNKILYVCGDFNINLLKEDMHVQTRQFLDTMFSMGLFPLITKPSRIMSHSATLIDNIFTNELKHESTSGLILNDISDHLPVFTLFEYKVKRQNDNSISYYRKVDTDSLQRLIKDLHKETWEELYLQESANMCYEEFLDKFERILEKNCPLTIKSSKSRDNLKPWLSKTLINACRKKNTLYIKSLKSKLQADEDKYKTYKNKLNKILKTAEQNYYNEQLNKHRKNMKATWKLLNEVISGAAMPSKIPDIFLEGKKELNSRKDIANGFNTFFVGVGPNLAAGIKKPDNACVEDYLPQPTADTMYLDPVNEMEIINTVKAFGNKNSLDCHGLNMSLIKQIIGPIATPFAHICNLSFESGVFPDSMKVAKVVPLFKSGQNNIFTNYRPVSLLPQFSKILEKLFNKRLDKFVNKYNILSESQYGFRENRSTSLALMELTEDLAQALDDRMHTIGVFIDLKKAFDTIDHKILLNKLYHYGLRGKANDWIKSYLEHRKQYVKIENVESDYMDVVCGVPQGSILGPKLFILYINDMCNVTKYLKFILFADDTNLFCSGHDINKLSKMVSDELYKLKDWFAVNRLSLNINKTNYMVFSNRRYVADVRIQICNVNISRVNVTKFLGVLIDDKLTWKEHIELVKTKVSKGIFLLNRAKHVLKSDALLTLYNSIVLPYMNYCCEIWGSTYKSRIHGIVLLQKRAMRIIHGTQYREHTSKLFLKSRALKLMDLITLNVTMIMYKAFYGMLPRHLQDLFSKKSKIQGIIATRHINKLKQPMGRTTLKCMCISISGVKIWNSLSEETIDQNRTVHSFKTAIKRSFLESY